MTAVAAADLVGATGRIVGLVYGLEPGTRIRVVSFHRASGDVLYYWVARLNDEQPAPTLYLAPHTSFAADGSGAAPALPDLPHA